MVIMLLGDAQKALGKNGLMTGCTVKVKDRARHPSPRCGPNRGPGCRSLRAEGKIRAKSPSEFVKQNGQVRMITAFALMVSVVTLVIGGIGVLNTMFMSVFERTREIGILRAIGWRPSCVMRMILMESVLLSIGGGIVGTVAGLGLIKLLSHVPTVNGVVQQAISVDIVVKGLPLRLS